MRVAPLLILLMLFACAPDSVDRAEWETMSPDERVLYVKSLLGEQKAKEAKGGETRTYDAPAAEYVARIDAAYARGDEREVREIFAGMETR